MSQTTTPRLAEFAQFQTLLKRQRQRLKKKQLGIKPGTGYELRGGVKRRISAQKLMALKRRGRRMARSAKQQRAMWMGRKRAKSLSSSKPKYAGGQRIKSDVDLADLLPGVEPLKEGERRFGREHILKCVEFWARGETNEALRNLFIDPQYQLEPIAALADEVSRKLREDGVKTYIDVEIVEGDSLAIYLEKGEGEYDRVKDLLVGYGDVGRVALPEKPLSKVENSAYHVIMLKPDEKTLASFDSAGVKQDGDGTKAETTASAGVSGYIGNVGVNIPPMVTVGGVGKDTDVNPRKDDTAHLTPSDYDDKFTRRWKKKKEKNIKKKSNLPLGKDPNLGQ